MASMPWETVGSSIHASLPLVDINFEQLVRIFRTLVKLGLQGIERFPGFRGPRLHQFTPDRSILRRTSRAERPGDRLGARCCGNRFVAGLGTSSHLVLAPSLASQGA